MWEQGVVGSAGGRAAIQKSLAECGVIFGTPVTLEGTALL